MNATVKKAFSVILSAMMLFGCVSVIAAAEEPAAGPSIVISSNAATPAGIGETAKLSLTGTDFSNVKGMDLTITAPNGVTFTDISGFFACTNAEDTLALTQSDNYILADNSIRIVSAFVLVPVSGFAATIQLSGAAVQDYTLGITVTLIKADETEFAKSEYVSTNGTLSIGKSELKTVAASDEPQPAYSFAPVANCFVPYGAVYSDGNNFAVKNADGTFALEANKSYSYKYFKLPDTDVGVTTFSTSKKDAIESSSIEYEQYNGIQFPSYALDSSKTLGTIVVKGDFEAFCAEKMAANSTSYPTKESVFERFAAIIVADSTWYKITYDTDKVIFIARIPQTKVMWKSDNSAIQYALRVFNVENDDRYTAVGYSVVGSDYTLSKEYQTCTYTPTAEN